MNFRQHNPPHPGRVLRHYLDIENTTIASVAAHLRVSRVTLSRILNGSAAISPAMAVRLSLALETNPEMWSSLQLKYDLWQARKALGKVTIKPLRPASVKSAA